MSGNRAEDSTASGAGPSGSRRPEGSSPYATGAGGITFERKVGVHFLAQMLAGAGFAEVTGGRRVVRVAFQQAPFEAADDIVLSAALPDETEPSLVIALAVRRAPKLVQSDRDSQKLIRQLVGTLLGGPFDRTDHRLGLVVSGHQTHAAQLAQLANLAAAQADAPGFFRLVTTRGRFNAGVRTRLAQLSSLVEQALQDLGAHPPAWELVEKRTWQLLSNLVVLMPRLEGHDDADWTRVADTLVAVVPDADPVAATGLRDKLLALADDYAPRAAQVDFTLLRRDVHDLLDATTQRHTRAWKTLDELHARACDSTCVEVRARDGRAVRLDRTATVERLRDAVYGTDAVVVSGASGVGKSALAVLDLAADDAAGGACQTLAVNLSQLPEIGLSLEATLGHRLSSLLSELSAPKRVLVVDGADAVAADREDVFRCLVAAARDSDVKLVAVTVNDGKQVVLDILDQYFGNNVVEFEVPLLTDAEIEQLVGTFDEIRRLFADPRSRELLRRLVVVDLLVRGGVSGMPLTDAEAMDEIWKDCVRRPGRPGRGLPVAREIVMLKLAELDLTAGDRIDALGGLNAVALEGLQQDGLLRISADDPFRIGPEFAHDELRRYALARLLLADREPAARLLSADAPRWTLSAARLACQAILALPNTLATPLRGRLAAQQTAFDALAEVSGSRWSDVPGEALLSLSDYEGLLADAWPQLLADDAVGLRRLARLVDQRSETAPASWTRLGWHRSSRSCSKRRRRGGPATTSRIFCATGCARWSWRGRRRDIPFVYFSTNV